MKITVSNKCVPSSDGSHILKGKVYFPEGEVKGYLHIVHGMTEHIGRYHAFMAKMASRGYIVFGFDNLGHGYTANYKSELGFIAHKKGCRTRQLLRGSLFTILHGLAWCGSLFLCVCFFSALI
jgi:alpha-beta hydrolase superfamily lysophospholipase